MSPNSNFSLTGSFEDIGSIIRVLSAVLTQLIDVNQKSNNRSHFVTKFQSSYAPNITIQAYLERINKYAKCSPNCFIVALIYIDRLIEMRNVVLTSLNVHRILITSILLSTKVFDDEFYKNAYYAKLGGVSTSEMNTLEVEFLSMVNFNLYVSTETFDKYQQELQSFLNGSSTDGSQFKKCLTGDSRPNIVVPEYERIHDPDLNSISPLRPFDVNNVTALRSLLSNPNAQFATTSNCSNTSLFSQDTLTPCPDPSTWLTFSSTLRPYESPRSLTSYPSTDPSPTLSSVNCTQKDSYVRPEIPSEAGAYMPPNLGNSSESDGRFAPTVAPPQTSYSVPNRSIQASMTFSQNVDPHFSGHQNHGIQKYSSRQRVSHGNTPTQQTHARVQHFQSRYPQHSFDGLSSSNLQHYDPSAQFPHAVPYHQNSCGYFPNQTPFCPVPTKNYGGIQHHFSGPYPPQQMQYMGGYYYQPIPSHMVPGPAFLAPCTTPNSVADIFCPMKTEMTHSRQFQCEDFPRPTQQPISRSSSGYGGSTLGVQHPYYTWNEHQDKMNCSTGIGHHFHQNIPGIPPDVNLYPATTLFYPVPLPTVS